MLVLSRKPGERIMVPGCELTVTVLAVHGQAVRIGITAPEDTAVYREEVWRRIRRAINPPAGNERKTSAGQRDS
jgi:carbon storage regulator